MKRIRETGAIILGVRDSSVPFSFLDVQNQPQGYSVDLCLKAADAIKADLKMPRLEIKFLPVSSANRIPALLENKIDLECGSTTNTRDRQKQVAFAYTTYVAGIKMLAKTSSNISGIEDLRGKKVVVTKGTTSEKMITTLNDERLLKLTLIESPDHNESFRKVESGEAVAFPMDDVLLYGLISKSKKPEDFAVVGKYLSVEPYAIMMRKDEPQLERIVNRALNELFQSGEIRRLYAKWFTTKELTVPLNQYLKEAFSVPNTYPAWP
ncbi:MAG: amino acid ABC transporter substrate-binding protein [Aromatoleum sp.]|nr:amino acid ABC transporter substrate-binding protein [Aromatoleum sp.]